MNEDKIKRFYIMPEVWVTVTQSQVFNWIKLVNEQGLSTDCISITDKKNSQEDVRKIEESIQGKFIQVHDFKRLLVSDIYTFLVLFKYYLKNVFKYDKIIFQTRIGIGTSYFILNWLPKVKLIFEARGAGNEETAHSNVGKKKNLKANIKNAFSEKNEKYLLTKSDKIICVSEALKDYYINKFKMKRDVFTVFPGAADSDYFYYNETLRTQLRAELSLNNKDVLVVYSGRLEMKWEIPDKIFEFFADLHKKNNNFKLLLLTPDIDLAKEFIDKFGFNKIVYVRESSFKDVNKYLNGSDVGLLLRENIVMNNVASPTKFAEYLMAGLPVIISHSIFDFAKNIDDTKFGVVVKGLDEIMEDELVKLNKSLLVDRLKISNWGASNLSKEVFIKRYIQVLKNI